MFRCRISRSSLSIGVTLTGTVTFAKDELGHKVDAYGVSLVACEGRRAPPRPARERDRDADYGDAAREFAHLWLPKLGR